MLKYLIVLLDDTSTPYCHYENPKTEYKLISLQDLRAYILLAMKENLMVQFVSPNQSVLYSGERHESTSLPLSHND